jgi:flagellar biosynthesis GTPase FlhF
MNLKKIHGKSIDEARSKAKSLYGDDVVVLETFDAIDEELPGITVLVDKPSRQILADDGAAGGEGGGGGSFRNVFYKRSDIGRLRTTAVFPSDGPAQSPGDVAMGGGRGATGRSVAGGNIDAGGSGTLGRSVVGRADTGGKSEDDRKFVGIRFPGNTAGDGLNDDNDGSGGRFAGLGSGTKPGGTGAGLGSGTKPGGTGAGLGSGTKPGGTGAGLGSGTKPDFGSGRFTPRTTTYSDDMPPPAEPKSLASPTIVPPPIEYATAGKPDLSRRLESLRRYASMQMASSGRFSAPMAPPSDYLIQPGQNEHKNSNSHAGPGIGQDEIGHEEYEQPEKAVSKQNQTQSEPNADSASGSGRFRFTGAARQPASTAKGTSRQVQAPEATAALNVAREDQTRREIIALHKRFEKLEALLDANLATTDLDLVAHPSFQQLVKSGVRPAVINRWFRQITGAGIDPEDQPEQFMNELSAIIRTALNRKPAGSPARVQLFTGSSGAGKTHMIMKLAAMSQRDGMRTAVISVEPTLADDQYYYSILELFCNDHQVAFYRVNTDTSYEAMAGELDSFDTVLIDTPPLSMRSDKAYRALYKLRKRWPAEIHYVANAGHGPHALEMVSRSHHTLKPDVVCITHMDEIDQWGPLIPFLSEFGCSCRWLGTGSSLYNGLTAYSPAFVAQKILQDS